MNKKINSKRITDRHNIIWCSSQMGSVIDTALLVAQSDANVLISGETGTGKELIARLVHHHSNRRKFVAINCAALTDSLVESELFGHEKGAFTNAYRKRAGVFEIVGDGSLLLDEVGDMTTVSQAKLLRVLQENVFSRIGSSTEIHANPRVISTTNRYLRDNMRDDLYFRLSTVHIHVPPLRERREDILPLSDYFAAVHRKTVSGCAYQLLIHHEWHGNVRELQNTITRAAIMCPIDVIRASDVKLHHLETSMEQCTNATLRDAIDNFKNDYISRVLMLNNGNRTRAAQSLDIQRTYLSRLIKRYDINTRL